MELDTWYLYSNHNGKALELDCVVRFFPLGIGVFGKTAKVSFWHLFKSNNLVNMKAQTGGCDQWNVIILVQSIPSFDLMQIANSLSPSRFLGFFFKTMGGIEMAGIAISIPASVFNYILVGTKASFLKFKTFKVCKKIFQNIFIFANPKFQFLSVFVKSQNNLVCSLKNGWVDFHEIWNVGLVYLFLYWLPCIFLSNWTLKFKTSAGFSFLNLEFFLFFIATSGFRSMFSKLEAVIWLLIHFFKVFPIRILWKIFNMFCSILK